MKTNKLLVAMVGAAILGGFTAKAMAENREGAFTITPGVGAYLFDSDRSIKNPAIYDVTLGYDFTNSWGVEALFGAMNSHTKGAVSRKVNGDLYLLDGVYHFNTKSPFEPYLLAGIGMLDLDPNGNVDAFNAHGDQAGTQANINGGAGLEYFVHHNIALRSDVRDIYTMTGGKNDYLVNFGVSILLGGQSSQNEAVAAPVSMMTVANPANPCVGTKVVVRFANDSAKIDPLYKTELQQVASCMQKNHRLKAVVHGYASSIGTAQYNLKLSQHRANNVKDYLVKHDTLKPTRIHAQSFGEADPVASNATTAGQALNRRAETVVVSVFDTGQS